uniref:LRAT domain-containing protein n=1 Tax=Panagrolaimus sp. ES5 TaxID=591445 RepID=A0AC34G4V1_9BILA
MGNEIERVWGKTHLGQYYCLITSKYWWYGVRLIIDEEYRHLEPQRERGVHRIGHGIVIKEDFLTREAASEYVSQSLQNHDGIYLGNCKVAHIGAPSSISGGCSNSSSNFKTSKEDKKEACARIVQFNEFVLSADQEVRIVVHSFRRKSRFEICEIAKQLVAERYGYGQYDLFNKNCQHFVTLCVLGEERRTDF